VVVTADPLVEMVRVHADFVNHPTPPARQRLAGAIELLG